jgi:hypothetical protein
VESANLRIKHYIQFVTTVQVPFTLKEMERVDVQELQRICDKELGDTAPSQCISARFVDSENMPILFYFGKRIKDISKKVGVSFYFISILIITKSISLTRMSFN